MVKRLLGYKIVDEYNGFVPEEFDEFHIFADIECLNRFFRKYEYESQWVVIPVYHDGYSPDESDAFGYRIIGREEIEAMIEEEYAGKTLLGYQIVSRGDYHPPDGIGENEVFTRIKFLDDFFRQHTSDKDVWIVIPVYEGDLEHPEIVTDFP
ncbi:MAG: hypothetical protein ACOYW7_14460 [Nitrospirota bacterium]